jgi:hypothetical protein
MEFGNAAFGHSNGNYEFDGYGIPGSLFSILLCELGLDDYGARLASTLEGNHDDIITITDRGTEFHDHDGKLLMITRAYWWGDDDDPEESLPNIEIPPLGITLSWYKYPFRDSYTNKPVTKDTIASIRELMEPVLQAIHDEVKHPHDINVKWIDQYHGSIDDPDGYYDKVVIDPEDNSPVLSDEPGHITVLGPRCKDNATAHEWVRLELQSWS